MEYSKVIQSRRSIRKFKQKKVDIETIKEIVNDAREAPSWKNSQTSRYYICYSLSFIQKIREALGEVNRHKINDETVLIVCSFVANKAGFNKEGKADNEAGNGWGYYDNGLSTMILQLSAKDRGLDSLVMGIRDENRIREVLSVNDDEIITSVIAVGYRDINPSQPLRKELNEIIKIV